MKKFTIILLFAVSSACMSKNPVKTREATPFPSFSLIMADSCTLFNTNNIETGNPIALFFFGPHCPYSRAQMDEILKNMSSLKNIQFCIFTTAAFSDFKLFYDHYNLNKYPNIKAGVDYTNFFVNHFKAIGVPYMAIYGKDKRLNKTCIGKIESWQIKKLAEG